MKKSLIIIVAVIIICGGAFYAGTKYSQNKIQGNFQNLRNLSPEQRQAMTGQFNASVGAGLRGANSENSGFVSGEIISKDDRSMVVKLRDGGSKIIFYSDSAQISKFTSGDSSDLEIGKTISVQGASNQDGSVTAQIIQIRPSLQAQPTQ